MAERSLLQYQPVTGPVWREPVASRMQWLPQGREFARGLLPNRLGDYVRPEFAALYKPEGLQWIPSDRYAGRALPSSKLDWTAFPVQVSAAPAFDPKNLEWIPSDRYAGKPLPYSIRRPYSVAVVALDPALLSWQPTDRYFGRALQRIVFDWSVYPQQVTAPAYDPQKLEWTPQGRIPQNIERRKLGDFTQPAFDALYKPERLEWVLQGREPSRNLVFVRQSSWIVDPKPVVIVPFDPQFFPFESIRLIRSLSLPRAIVGDYSTPPLPPGPDVVVVVVTDQGTFNLRPRRRKKKKIEEVEYLEQKEYIEPQVVAPEHLEALAKALAEHGIPISQILLDYEIEFDEEDLLLQAITTKLIQ